MKTLDISIVDKHFAEIIGFCKPLVKRLDNEEKVIVPIPETDMSLKLSAGIVDKANDHFCAKVSIGKSYTYATDSHYACVECQSTGAIVDKGDCCYDIFAVSEPARRALVRHWQEVKAKLLADIESLESEPDEVDNFKL